MTIDDSMPEDMQRLAHAALQLGEHFDSVRIFATRHEPETEEGTVNSTYGVGNYLAQLGQVDLWLEAQREERRIHKRNEHRE